MALVGVHSQDMDWKQILTDAIVSAGFTLGTLRVFGLKVIEKALDHSLDKKLEEHKAALALELQNAQQMVEVAQSKFLKDYERHQEIRDRAAGVAELLSVALSGECTPERFNRLAWELSLWLPKDIVEQLTLCLCGADKAKTTKEILIMVRQVLLGTNDNLAPESIVHRPMDAFNAEQKRAAEYLYQTAFELRDALRDYHYASLPMVETKDQKSLDEMRNQYDKACAIEKNLVRFLSTPNTLPRSIMEAGSAYRGAAVKVFQQIDSVRAGHHMGFAELERDMVEEMKKLRALLDMGYVNGLPLPMPPP